MKRLAALLEQKWDGKRNYKIYAVDFDGTIADGPSEHVMYKDGEIPIGNEKPGAIKALKDLQADKHIIILWTCRSGKDLDAAVAWLKEKGFVPDYINKNDPGHSFVKGPKVFADEYWDDKSWPPFPGWDAVRKRLLK